MAERVIVPDEREVDETSVEPILSLNAVTSDKYSRSGAAGAAAAREPFGPEPRSRQVLQHVAVGARQTISAAKKSSCDSQIVTRECCCM